MRAGDKFIQIWSVHLKRRGHLDDTGADERII
jgi:hypothetical protein